jgi:hypothetical protein
MAKLQLVITDDNGTLYNVTSSDATVDVVAPPVVTPPVVTPPVGSTSDLPVVAGAPVIPANAVRINMLKPPNPWQMNHDKGTPGDASGTVAYPYTSPDGKTCMRVVFTTKDGGGFIIHGVAKKGISQFNKFAFRKREKKVDAGGWKTLNQVETDLEATRKDTGIPDDMAMQQSATSGQGEEISINHKWTPTGVQINPQARDNSAWHTTENYLTLNPDRSFVVDGVAFDNKWNPIGKTITDPDSSPWGTDEMNVQAQWNGIKGTVNHEILIDFFEIAMWYEPVATPAKAA